MSYLYGSTESRSSEFGSQSELARTVKAQAVVIEERLMQLKIKGLHVRTSIFHVPAEQFDNVLTLGIMSGLSEDGVAFVAASPHVQENPPVLPVLILPSLDGPGILEDGDSEGLFTNGFWVRREREIQFILPQRPIQLDGLLRMYDADRDLHGHEAIVDRNSIFQEAAEDKQSVKHILEEAGIPVPPGIFIPNAEQESIAEKLTSLQETLDISEGFVVKGNTGSQGINVRLFASNQLEEAQLFAQELFGKGLDVIVEQRIIPIDFEKGRRTKRTTNVDSNARVITTIDRGKGVIVDSEVRYAPLGYSPVNVSQGASARRLEDAYSDSVSYDMHMAAIAATDALLNAVFPGGREPMLALLGWDIITDRNGKNFVIEGNGGNIGGFGTLTRLDKAPLSSVTNYLISVARRFLLGTHTRRVHTDKNTLTPLPLTPNDEINLLYLFMHTKDHKQIEKIVARISEIPESLIEAFADVIMDLTTLNMHDQANDLLTVIDQEGNSDLPAVQRAYALLFMRQLGIGVEAAEALLNAPVEQNEIFVDNYALLIAQKGDRDRAEEIVRAWFNEHPEPRKDIELSIAEHMFHIYATLTSESMRFIPHALLYELKRKALDKQRQISLTSVFNTNRHRISL